MKLNFSGVSCIALRVLADPDVCVCVSECLCVCEWDLNSNSILHPAHSTEYVRSTKRHCVLVSEICFTLCYITLVVICSRFYLKYGIV
jgi:hypothetical protein